MGERFALAVHGGAGARRGLDYSEQEHYLRNILGVGAGALVAGASALDVVTDMVSMMEASGLYVAGKGSAPNADGDVELDASIMDGPSQACGAVAGLRGFVHPVRIARGVMEETTHVLLVAEGAAQFAATKNFQIVPNPHEYYVGYQQEAKIRALDHQQAQHGTVGAVARDLEGRLAAATSTGGLFGKLPGRAGDTPLVGAGTWADSSVAVSCTGDGEYFIRACAAHDVAARMRYSGADLVTATRAMLDQVAALGGNGGVIAIDANGTVALPFNSQGMKCGFVTNDAPVRTAVFSTLP